MAVILLYVCGGSQHSEFNAVHFTNFISRFVDFINIAIYTTCEFKCVRNQRYKYYFRKKKSIETNTKYLNVTV